jgi:hypothetical protein
MPANPANMPCCWLFCHKANGEKSKQLKRRKAVENLLKPKSSWFALYAGGIAWWSGK